MPRGLALTFLVLSKSASVFVMRFTEACFFFLYRISNGATFDTKTAVEGH